MHTIFCHLFSVNIKELVWWWEESVANQTQEEMGASEGGTKRERGTVFQKSNTQVQNTHWIETGFRVNAFESTLTTASFFAAEEHVAGFKSPGGTWGLAAEAEGSESWRIQHRQNQNGYRSTGEFDNYENNSVTGLTASM